MKNIITLCVLVSVLMIGQSCAPRKDEAKVANADKPGEAPAELVKLRTADEIAATRVKIANETAEKDAQRKLAIEEKAKATPTYTDASGKIVYYKPTVVPSYTDGLDEMREYLNENLTYPEAAREKGYEGTVFVDFIIDEKGRVREVVASDVVGEVVDLSFKEESVRVVAAMPGWKAGRQNGKPVDTAFSIPITFQLAD